MKQKNILIIKHGAFGDMVAATGAFATIRRNHSQDHLTLLTGPRFKELAEGMGCFDEVMVDLRSNDPRQLWQLYRLLTLRKYSRVYDLQNSLRTTAYFGLMRLQYKLEWSGIAIGCSHRQTRRDRELLPTSKRFADQLAVAGLDLFGQEELIPDVSWLQADVSRFNLHNRNYALLVPGSSKKGLVKRWPAKKYIEIARWLAEQHIVPVIIAGNEEQDVVQEICLNVPQALDLSRTTTIFEIAALARGAKLAIGNDTGPTHLIAATGCSTVVVWSNFSEYSIYAPRGEHVKIIYEPDLANLEVERVQQVLNQLLYPSISKP
jgi:ADP-heptose:LPS heptosyltransferase